MTIPQLLRIGAVCEGAGDGLALRTLLPRIPAVDGTFIELGDSFDAKGRGNLTVPGGIEKYYRLAAPGHEAVLVLLDADGDCPVRLARGLARRVRALGPRVPVAIVVANHEIEAWFLADIGSIVGQPVKGRVLIADAADPPVDPDSVHNPKSRLMALTATRTKYKESRDPASLATLIDPDVVADRSRSFRRLVSALRQLAVGAADTGVSP